MAFFKTKQEKEIIAKMEREEQMQVFNDQINELKTKQKEYAKIAAEAEINGDTASYDLAVNALIELNECTSSLIQTKTNFDLINISNSLATNMAMAMNALEKMAGNKLKLPNIRKIQKAQIKMQKYMRNIKISQKAMSGAMKMTNPANKARSEEEIASVKALIDAEKSKITSMSSIKQSDKDLDISQEIAKEKNRII